MTLGFGGLFCFYKEVAINTELSLKEGRGGLRET